MKAFLSYNNGIDSNTPIVNIAGSKSESNRLLILKKLYPGLEIENLSDCNDTVVLQKALSSSEKTIDIHHAGTAMRFLTAYFSVCEGKEVVLTGSKRMKERPIGILVDALNSIGADIEYVNKKGYPPLLIKGKQFIKNKVTLEANVSSQYISALMLIGSIIPSGLEIQLQGEITSKPYIDMTLSFLKNIGIQCSFSENRIQISSLKNIKDKTITIESDWSSASYFYSFIALSKNKSVTLKHYQENSLQGDSILPSIYKSFGVQTVFNNNSITLTKVEKTSKKSILIDLKESPDIAQTIAVTCIGLGLHCKLTGLHTLKIKETDRLEALKIELSKFGATVLITENTLEVFPLDELDLNVQVDTYQDHRMAMAFAPLVLKTSLAINDPKVVEKSYPNYWNDIENIGVSVNFK